MVVFRLVVIVSCISLAVCFAAPQLWVERAGSAHLMLTTVTQEPAVRQAVLQPETGVLIRRITDVSEYSTSLTSSFPVYNDSPRRGLHNGYSRFPCVSLDGQYILAYGTTPLTVLIRASDLMPIGMPQTTKNSTGKLGDLDEIKWSGNPATPHVIGYTGGQKYFMQDVTENPSWERITPNEWEHGDLGATVISTADGDWDNEGRMIAQKTYWPGSTGAARVLLHGALLPGAVVQNGINGVDISPTGKYLKVDNRFFDLPSFNYRNRNEPGHGGWVRDRDGREWFVNQNSRTDWIEAFDPETSETRYLMRMNEIGGNGIHVASAKRGQHYPGFALVSTYGGSDPLCNNVFYLELKNQKPGMRHPYYYSGTIQERNNYLRQWEALKIPDSEMPLIIRVANMQNEYVLYETVETGTDGTTRTVTVGEYQTEAFASEGIDGHVYVGSNWHATDNIELYRFELPAEMKEILRSGVAPNGVRAADAWMKLDEE